MSGCAGTTAQMLQPFSVQVVYEMKKTRKSYAVMQYNNGAPLWPSWRSASFAGGIFVFRVSCVAINTLCHILNGHQ